MNLDTIKQTSSAPQIQLSERIQYDSNSGKLIDSETKKSIGHLKASDDVIQNIEIFWGKGGLMSVLQSKDDVIYFGLPGSKVEVGGTTLELTHELSEEALYEICHPQIKSIDAVQSQSTQAMILGAGLATRFERISGNTTHYSKPAIPLMGKESVISCLASHLALHGYKNLYINTYFKPESLKSSLAAVSSDKAKPEKVLYIDELAPSGTAGALRKLLTEKDYSGWLDTSKPLLVAQGDSVTDADFSALMDAHVKNNALVTMGCQLVADEDVSKFGILVTDQSGSDSVSGKIIGFQEKPSLEEAKSRMGNTGFYIFSPKAFPLIKEIYEEKQKESGKPNEEFELDFAQHVFPGLLKRIEQNPGLGIFWAEQMHCYWSDIGNPKQYISSIRDIYSGKLGIKLPQNPEQYYQQGVIYWHGALEAAQKESAKLEGNVVVALRFSPQ
jgi:NDP-sugar pyrophosphorylase family protein